MASFSQTWPAVLGEFGEIELNLIYRHFPLSRLKLSLLWGNGSFGENLTELKTPPQKNYEKNTLP